MKIKSNLALVGVLGLILVFFVGTLFAGKLTGKFTATTGDLTVTSNGAGSLYTAKVGYDKAIYCKSGPCPPDFIILGSGTLPLVVSNLDQSHKLSTKFYYNNVLSASVGTALALNQMNYVNYNYPPSAYCMDSLKDGDETDVDCGGSCTTKCRLNKGCNVDSDCFLGTSSGLLCFVNLCKNSFSQCMESGSDTTIIGTGRRGSLNGGGIRYTSIWATATDTTCTIEVNGTTTPGIDHYCTSTEPTTRIDWTNLIGARNLPCS